jgi:pantoate--beta-alanine ligase
MEILRTIEAFREWRAQPKGRDPAMDVAIKADRAPEGGLRIGFVPTMGALHAGHMRLVEASRAANPLTAVSIFVNPLQFGPKEDFARYPRPFEADVELCRGAGVDALFAPEAADFYAPDHATYCDVEGLGDHLCGAARPGHFRGVCTVVLKLSLDLEMEVVETVREASGLALSSRNAYLSPEEKDRATALSRGLFKAKKAWLAGEKDAAALKALVREEIEASSPTRIDYVEAVSQASLAPVGKVEGPAALAVAAFYGKTRLIDNVLLP